MDVETESVLLNDYICSSSVLWKMSFPTKLLVSTQRSKLENIQCCSCLYYLNVAHLSYPQSSVREGIRQISSIHLHSSLPLHIYKYIHSWKWGHHVQNHLLSLPFRESSHQTSEPLPLLPEAGTATCSLWLHPSLWYKEGLIAGWCHKGLLPQWVLQIILPSAHGYVSNHHRN